jgi:hypothetical protein
MSSSESGARMLALHLVSGWTEVQCHQTHRVFTNITVVNTFDWSCRITLKFSCTHCSNRTKREQIWALLYWGKSH